jgi:hypothetical protein
MAVIFTVDVWCPFHMRRNDRPLFLCIKDTIAGNSNVYSHVLENHTFPRFDAGSYLVMQEAGTYLYVAIMEWAVFE